MNHCVPVFETQIMDDHDYPIPIPSASGLPRQKKPSIADDEIMELLWQNGQVVTQSQNQRQLRKPPPARNSDGGPSSARPEVENYNQYLFMQEGEMAWLHYAIDDDAPPLDQSFCADFLNPPPTVNNNSTMQTPPRTSQLTEHRHQPMSVAPPRPPIPPSRRPEQVRPKTTNFAHFSRQSAMVEPGPSPISRTAARESTMVDSCDTPAPPPPAISETARSSAEPTEGAAMAVPSTTFDEPGGSSSSGEPFQKVAEQERKRKGREADEWEYQSENGKRSNLKGVMVPL